jgi:UDP-2,3-diacylglucosamine pyrophosphatase LpxH
MHDVIVLSDLHIGKGRSPRTRRFHGLETFFFDEDMRRFLQWCCGDAKARGTSVRVVFNGDTFDLLRMDDTAGAEASRRERRFGADLTPAVAAQLVAQILEGHPIFVEAVAEVLAAGSQVVFLPGNHDLEVQWSPVHDEMRRAVRAALERRGVPVDEALGRLSFAPWFVYEPGRIWIEHGCQYDPENAYRYPLRGALEADALDPNLLELDMPLGNFFQKYLYNGFGPLTFIVPSTRANARYSRWLLLHQPKLLLRVVWSHAPFVLQAIRRLTAKKAEGRQSLEEAHARELARLAMESGLGEKLAAIDAQKTVRGDLMQATREYGLQGLRALMLATGFALAGTGLWASGFFAINELSSGFGLKALLFLVLNFVMMAAVGGATAYLIVREGPPPSPWPQRRAARRIARLLGVPFVTFGHTHEEAVWPIRQRDGSTGWYYNTGTWISVFTHDVLLPRERVQFTFLRVKGMEAELLHWSPGRGEPLPVILLDEPDGIVATPTAAPAAEVS